MKKDIVNLSKEEYEYLKSIDLNLTKETGIYFDYDLIMANIDKTPREIIQMDDTIDRRFLSWFDKLFASNLENFFGDYYKTNITTHGYTKIVDIIINANNKDQEVLMIIKNNVLDKLQKLPHMVDLIESFCNNNLNISLTSKLLYMHRNTVINKLDQIEKLTGLDIQKFKDAYAIKILIDLKN